MSCPHILVLPGVMQGSPAVQEGLGPESQMQTCLINASPSGQVAFSKKISPRSAVKAEALLQKYFSSGFI